MSKKNQKKILLLLRLMSPMKLLMLQLCPKITKKNTIVTTTSEIINDIITVDTSKPMPDAITEVFTDSTSKPNEVTSPTIINNNSESTGNTNAVTSVVDSTTTATDTSKPMPDAVTEVFTDSTSKPNEAISPTIINNNSETATSAVASGSPPDMQNFVEFKYPFLGGTMIEQATNGLCYGQEKSVLASHQIMKLQEEKCRPKKTWMKVTLEDYKRLEPDVYLNDTVLDFWLNWITRNESEKDSVIYLFSTQFYTKMTEVDGIKTVTAWTTKKDLDVFTKKMLFLPIHKDFHWSLCIICNAGNVNSSDCVEEDTSFEVPFILFLDPLDYHSRKNVCGTVRQWLNAEWSKKHVTPRPIFTPITIEAFSPSGKCFLLHISKARLCNQ
jgi:Ulp1 family protease